MSLSLESVVSVNTSIDKNRPCFKPYSVASRGFKDEAKAWNHLEANCPEWYDSGATVYKHTSRTASWSKPVTLFYIVEPN